MTEENPFSWANEQIHELCGLKSTMFIDISSVNNILWENEENHTDENIQLLRQAMQPLIKLLISVNCLPSCKPMTSINESQGINNSVDSNSNQLSRKS